MNISIFNSPREHKLFQYIFWLVHSIPLIEILHMRFAFPSLQSPPSINWTSFKHRNELTQLQINKCHPLKWAMQSPCFVLLSFHPGWCYFYSSSLNGNRLAVINQWIERIKRQINFPCTDTAATEPDGAISQPLTDSQQLPVTCAIIMILTVLLFASFLLPVFWVWGEANKCNGAFHRWPSDGSI